MKDSKFSTNLIELINTIRTNIDEAVPLIDEYKQDYLTFYPSKTDRINQLDQIRKSIEKGETQNLNEIEENKTLTEVAYFILGDIADSNKKKFYPENDEFLNSTLNFYFSGINKCRNFVSTKEDAKDVLEDILTDPNAVDIGHHLLLEPNINSIGIAHDYIKEHTVTVVVISDSVEERKDENLEESLIDDINALRTFPKIALRLLPEKSQNTAELIATKKPCSELKLNQKLNNAASDRINSMDKNTQPLTSKKLNDYLNQFGSGHLIAEEIIIEEGFESSMDLIIYLLSNEDLVNTIFSNKMKEIGLVLDSENGTGVIYLVNKFKEPIEENEIVVESLHRKLMRPKLTDDELLQIENDFNKFDILKKGKIIPKNILVFIEKNEQFKELNPWYYNAFKNLNTEEINKVGVDLPQFTEEVQKVINECNRKFEDNWGNIYDNVAGGPNEIIGKKELLNLIKKLGYEGTMDDAKNLIDKLEGNIDKKKFLEICKIIEYRFAQFKKKRNKI